MPLSVEKQVVTIFAGTQGYCDELPVSALGAFESELHKHIESKHSDVLEDIRTKKEIDKDSKLKDELIQVKFKSAYIFQKYFHFDEAAERFGELIRRWPANDFARRGADSILDSYAAREKWAPLEKWSRDCRITDIYAGTGEIQRLIIARGLLEYSRADLS